MEIEIRAFVKNFDEIAKKLENLNCKKIEESMILDSWFCRKDAESFEDVRMGKEGSFGIRIRVQDKSDPELNIKTIIKDGDHNVFDEVSTTFKDASSVRKMLELLGFKEFCTIKKKRETYQLDEMKINLEDIEGFPPCIEIEIIGDDRFEQRLARINKMLDQLEISKEDRIETSITSLFMERYAFGQG